MGVSERICSDANLSGAHFVAFVIAPGTLNMYPSAVEVLTAHILRQQQGNEQRQRRLIDGA